ncbi:MAG: signal peptide peptidase SppA [Candidatus Sericytochromatia bacterium]
MKLKHSLTLAFSISLLNINPVYADYIDNALNFNNTEVNGYNSVSTSDDSSSMVINPGGIGLRQEGEIFFSNSIFNSLPQTNLFLTYSNFNLGYQQFTPRGKFLNPMRKFVFGTGYPIFDGLSLGVTYSNIQTTDNSNLSTNSIDFGILARPANFLSVGLFARNINNPILGSSIINRTYGLGLGIRPGGWDRLTVTLDGEWVEGSPANRIKGLLGLETEFINGVHLKGRVASDATFKNIAFGVEAGIAFPYISLGYGRVFDVESRDAVYAKLSLNKSRTIFEGEESDAAEITLNGAIQSVKNINVGLFSVESRNSVFDYLENIEKAKNDRSIGAIILNMKNFSSGLADNEEIRNKLIDFKSSGKKVIAYISSLDMKQYYLATVADYIVMHPIGEIQLQGIGGTQYFYKGLMDKVGVEAQYEKIGKYKSASEPLTRTNSSDPEKEQTNDLLKDFYNNMSKNISKSRGITEQQLKEIVDKKTIINSNDSKDLKLIDKIAHYDEMGKIVADFLKKKGRYNVVKIAYVDYKKYNWRDENKIAIINASGTIIEGESTRDFLSGETTIGADTIARMLDKARKDDDIKAVVLRVDSGGGSALASDIIGREISRYKDEKKPIVISMANVAASGGYWLTTDADKVLANENTVTGSIGVFTGKINIAKLLDKLGVTTESFKIGDHADAFTETRAFNEEELKILRESTKNIYRTFLERVATGRKMTVAKVDELGQGRVYSGTRAKTLNLVDEIGGLDKAIQIALELAKIKKDKTQIFNYKNGLEDLSYTNTDPRMAFHSLVMLKLVKENKVLAIMPNFEIN